MSRNPYPIETIINCCSKYRTGETVNTIVKECGIPRSTVYYWIRQYRDIPETNEIKLKKTLDNINRGFEKSQHICEVLKSVNCTCHAPLKTRLYELEKLYGQFSVRELCEALDVDRGTFYNHMLRNKKNDTSYKKGGGNCQKRSGEYTRKVTAFSDRTKSFRFYLVGDFIRVRRWCAN